MNYLISLTVSWEDHLRPRKIHLKSLTVSRSICSSYELTNYLDSLVGGSSTASNDPPEVLDSLVGGSFTASNDPPEVLDSLVGGVPGRDAVQAVAHCLDRHGQAPHAVVRVGVEARVVLAAEPVVQGFVRRHVLSTLKHCQELDRWE